MKHPDFPHRIWFPFQGSAFDRKSEELFREITEWCLRSNINPIQDLETFFAKGLKDSDPEVYPPLEPIRWIVFCFKDPAKAAQFKLAWG